MGELEVLEVVAVAAAERSSKVAAIAEVVGAGAGAEVGSP